jgi:hypothetical protein
MTEVERTSAGLQTVIPGCEPAHIAEIDDARA